MLLGGEVGSSLPSARLEKVPAPLETGSSDLQGVMAASSSDLQLLSHLSHFQEIPAHPCAQPGWSSSLTPGGDTGSGWGSGALRAFGV